MIIGTCHDEWAFWETFRVKDNQVAWTDYTKPKIEAYIADKFANFLGDQSQKAIELFENLYLDPGTEDDDNLAWFKFTVDVGTALFFSAFDAHDVELHLYNNNTNIYLYQFTYSPNPYPNSSYNYYPVPHCFELAYEFMPNYWTQSASKIDLQLSDFFGEAWTNFATYGKPFLNDTWKAVTSTGLTTMEYMDINPNSGMKSGYRTLDRVQMSRVLPILLGTLPPEIPDYNNGSTLGCPTGWTKSSINSKRCYNIYSSTTSQNLAQTQCAKFFGSLLSIQNAFENNVVQTYITSNGQNCTKTFIGLVENGSTWSWSNGDTSTYRNWDAGLGFF
uniref:C-type lectin domain-containing protein n=1 Tax=Acrobeloides nanus TaxID=290746 RepID=A0A914CEN4_9BILA